MHLRSLKAFSRSFSFKRAPGKIQEFDFLRTTALELGLNLALKNVIHVVGTNGKGSVVSMLQDIYTKAGYKVHSYTSPHLMHMNERIKLYGKSISDEELLAAINYVLSHPKAEFLKFFDVLTLAAFWCFSKNPADIILLEAGLGACFDPTNLIVDPMAVVITKISLDHQDVLGHTLTSITKNKACAIKKRVLCVTASNQEPEVLNILQKTAQSQESSLIVSKKDETFSTLQGYLAQNATLCLEVLEHLNNRFPVSLQTISDAFKDFSYKGRLQKIQSGLLKDLFQNQEIILDGAHNEDGFMALAEFLDSSPQKTLIIAGFSQLSRHAGFEKHLKSPLFEFLYLEQVPLYPKKQKVYKNLTSALKKAYKKRKDFSRIIITGSLYLVGDVLKNYVNDE